MVRAARGAASRARSTHRVGELALLAASLLLAACSPYVARHQIQWDSRTQIWRAEASQVKVRAAQSRVFDTSDKVRVLAAVVATFQDLGFQVEVLDEELGVVSGKKFTNLERPKVVPDPSYFLYDEGALIVFTKAFRSWGPFWHRSDLVRLTVTVRERNQSQLIVRASLQFYLRPIESPEPYQKFFRAVEQTLFLEGQLSPDTSAVAPDPRSSELGENAG
jgi:hypothetical protein